MFSSLLTASLEANNIVFLAKLPRLVLNPLENEAITFVLEYREKYGVTPSTGRFKAEQDGKFAFLITRYLTGSPLQDLFDQTIQIKKEEYFFENVRDIEQRLARGESLSPSYITGLGRNLAALESLDHESVLNMNREDLYSSVIPSGLRLGYETIDKAIGAIMGGEYGIIAARPGVGKTFLLCFLTVKWFMEGKRILFISCEMPVPALVARLDGIIGKFNPRILRTKEDPSKLEELKNRVTEEYQRIQVLGGDIVFPKSRAVSVSNLYGLIDDHRPDAVVVDGIYLMRTDSGTALSDWQKLKTVSNELKQTALSCNLPILGTTQLKRTGKEDGFTTEDIAYSDALGQDADLILAMHSRPGASREMIVDVLKNRNGEGIGSINLILDWVNMEARELIWEEEADWVNIEGSLESEED